MIGFFTRNPFDVTGARAAGMSAIWVDRQRKGWVDNLPSCKDLSSESTMDYDLGPTTIVHGLDEIPKTVETTLSK